ncbi:MAG: DNRLRE domain-containing protein, partial [Gemmatimonadetes bacterium]|nr:DNRLRE domain-containing protein [Gemmatimonadota bacterium]
MPSRPSPLFRSLLLLGVAAALFAAPAFAQSIHYTVVTDQDTYLDEKNPTATHGTEQTVVAQRKVGDQFWALFGFDLSAIPTGAVVDSAYLDVFATREDNTGLPVEVRRVTGA